MTLAEKVYLRSLARKEAADTAQEVAIDTLAAILAGGGTAYGLNGPLSGLERAGKGVSAKKDKLEKAMNLAVRRAENADHMPRSAALDSSFKRLVGSRKGNYGKYVSQPRVQSILKKFALMNKVPGGKYGVMAGGGALAAALAALGAHAAQNA